MGVEPTTRLAKSRINGFEGHEDHRTPFASDLAETPTQDYSSRGNGHDSRAGLRSVLGLGRGALLAREFQQLRVSANFVIRAVALRADLSAGQELPAANDKS